MSWEKDVEAALAEAKRSGRLLLLHFQLAGRPACKRMSEETFADPEVARRLTSFLAVLLDMAAQPELFDRIVGGKGAIGTAVVDATLDPVSVLPGFAEPRDFLRFLDIAEKGYPRLKTARGPRELGDVYRDLRSPRRAEACWREGVEKGDAACHERLARALVQRGRNLEARTHLEAFRKSAIADGLDRARLTEGLILSLERRHAEAARVLEEALKSHPASDEADQMTLALGFVLHEGGNDKRALETLEGLLKLFPGSPWTSDARRRIEHIRNPQPDHTH